MTPNSLSDAMLSYATKYFSKYVPEKELREAAIQENPVSGFLIK